MKINDLVIKMQIWDTCGQEIYKSLISNFYRNSSLAVIVYSIDNKESFEHAENWLTDLKSQANPDVRIFLVGNKSDLEDERKVSKDDGLKFKNDQGLDLFMETSAKTGYNARNVLIEAAKMEKTKQSQVIGRLKAISNMFQEKQDSQDGRIIMYPDYNIRVSSQKNIHGEKMVLRLMKKEANIQGLEELGYDDEVKEAGK